MLRLFHQALNTLTGRGLDGRDEAAAAAFIQVGRCQGWGHWLPPRRGPAPYRAVWASVAPQVEHVILTGHRGWVSGVCTVEIDGQALLATASNDTTVRIWDLTTGPPLAWIPSYAIPNALTPVNRHLVIGLRQGSDKIIVCDR